MRQNIVVFGAHPDDGEIGAGGTIAAYARRGHRVVMVNLRIPSANGDTCPKTRELRHAEGREAARILGAELIYFDLPRHAIRPDANLVGAIDRLLDDIRPAAIFTHWTGDSHPEHVAATRAVLAATRRNGCSVYMYEPTIPGGVTEGAFRAQKFVDVTATIDAKMASLSCYETQIANYGQPWLDAIRGRAAHRGFQIGCGYAEAFEVVKMITEIPDVVSA